MFEDDRPVPKNQSLPANLEPMSLEEIRHYIARLKEEIQRCEAEIARKQAHMDAAASLFKGL